VEDPKLVVRTSAGEVALARADLAAMAASAQVGDVSAVVPGRAGRAVRLSALIERAGGRAGARFLNISSRDPSFAVSIPLAEAEDALVVYDLAGAALPDAKGGPFRLLVPGHADECVHVKQVARLELSERAGRDTRPRDDTEHAKLHQKKK
jgi:2-dehydropantoate 2-reductase